MLKILQARLQQYVNHELPDVQTGFRKGRGTKDQLPTSAGSSKKKDNSRKTLISALLTMPKPLTVWITVNCVKFWRRWKHQTTWPASWETYMQIRKQHLDLAMEQQTGSNQNGHHQKSKRVPEKHLFCFTDYAKAFDHVGHNKLKNSERDGNTRPPNLPLEKSVCRSGSNG